MTDMVERVARAFATQEAIRILGSSIPRHIDLVWPQRINEARAAIAAAFKVTDEDAKVFFGVDFANTEWKIDHREVISFSKAMQALSDTALKEGS